VVADINSLRVKAACDRSQARAVGVDEILAVKADVLSPCALGGVLDQATVPRIQAPIVAGAANNQLATREDGHRLHELGVLYLPDFLINAGGIISAARECLETGTHESVREEVGQIAGRVAWVLARAKAERLAPVEVAVAWAKEKLQVSHETISDPNPSSYSAMFAQ
jgi:leucine dehydrogenase